MSTHSYLTGGLTAAVAWCLLTPGAFAQTFGSSRGGLFEDDSAGFSRVEGGCVASGVAIQPDKKIIAVGNLFQGRDNPLVVVRFNTDGTLDTSFGDRAGDARAGYLQLVVGKRGETKSVAVDPNSGAVYVAGSARFGATPAAFVLRLTPDGEVDKSFHEDGILEFEFEAQFDLGSGFGKQPTWGTDVEIDLNGNVVVGGRTGRPNDCDAFVAIFSNSGELHWSQKHGTGGFDDGVNALSVPLKAPPYRIYTTGFSTITNLVKAFDCDGDLYVRQSSLGFCVRSFGISYDESTDRVVCAGNLGKDMVVRALTSRPEVISDIVFENPFQAKSIDSYCRAIQHLANGRVAVVGHGRPYDAADDTARRFQFCLYDPDARLIAHDSPDLGASAAALDVAVQGDSLIVLAGRVMTKQLTPETANFKMGFVAYDGDGKMVGQPWTFEPGESK